VEAQLLQELQRQRWLFVEWLPLWNLKVCVVEIHHLMSDVAVKYSEWTGHLYFVISDDWLSVNCDWLPVQVSQMKQNLAVCFEFSKIFLELGHLL
jgi:hypothetical protein